MLEEQLSYVDSLPEILKESLYHYTTGKGYDINTQLREDRVTPPYQELIDNIDTAFEGVPQLSHPITVYRSIDKHLAFNYSSEGFVLVTTDQYEALSGLDEINGKMCCVLEVTVPSGTRVLPVMNISQHKNEKEIILPRGGTMKFISENIKRIDGEIYLWLYFSYEQPASNLPRIGSVNQQTASQIQSITEIITYDKLQELWEESHEFGGDINDFKTDVRLYIAELCKRIGCIDGVQEIVFNSLPLEKFQ